MKYLDVKTIDGGTIKLAKYVLGSTAFSRLPEEETFALIDRFIELGGNAIDTARAYGGEMDQKSYGTCEAMVGEYIRSRNCRNKLLVITKGAFPALNLPDLSMKRFRLSREAILGDFYTSYDNLRVGPIDMYLLHRDDPSLPVSAIMDTLHEITDRGLVRAIGVSNWSMGRILEANAYARSKGKAEFAISEIMWGYAYVNHKMRNDETLSIMDPQLYGQYLEHKIPIISFTSQSGGLWTFLNKGLETWETLDRRRKIFDCPENRAKLEKVNEYCAKHGVSAAALVTAYLACNKVACGPIVGCMTVDELNDTMSGADLDLYQATIDWMDDVKF